MSVADTITEDRRLQVLKGLAESSNRTLSEQILLQVLLATGRDSDHDRMRADLLFLEGAGAVRIERLPHGSAEMWVPGLTDAGDRAARGTQKLYGVAKRPVV